MMCLGPFGVFFHRLLLYYFTNYIFRCDLSMATWRVNKSTYIYNHHHNTTSRWESWDPKDDSTMSQCVHEESMSTWKVDEYTKSRDVSLPVLILLTYLLRLFWKLLQSSLYVYFLYCTIPLKTFLKQKKFELGNFFLSSLFRKPVEKTRENLYPCVEGRGFARVQIPSEPVRATYKQEEAETLKRVGSL